MEIVVNRCYGGFSLSLKALDLYYTRKYGKRVYAFHNENFSMDEFYRVEKVTSEMSTFGTYYAAIDKDVITREELNEHIVSQYLYEARDDPILVEIVSELGHEANGWSAELEIVDIPDDVEWDIEDYDGIETIHEVHRSW